MIRNLGDRRNDGCALNHATTSTPESNASHSMLEALNSSQNSLFSSLSMWGSHHINCKPDGGVGGGGVGNGTLVSPT
jgi:hypothetical protein